MMPDSDSDSEYQVTIRRAAALDERIADSDFDLGIASIRRESQERELASLRRRATVGRANDQEVTSMEGRLGETIASIATLSADLVDLRAEREGVQKPISDHDAQVEAIRQASALTHRDALAAKCWDHLSTAIILAREVHGADRLCPTPMDTDHFLDDGRAIRALQDGLRHGVAIPFQHAGEVMTIPQSDGIVMAANEITRVR